MLDPLLHVQHLNCCFAQDLVELFDAHHDHVHPDHLARIRQLSHEPGHLHSVQPRVQEGVQEDHLLPDQAAAAAATAAADDASGKDGG